MQRTVVCKAAPAPDVAEAVRRTAREYAAACDAILLVATEAGTSNKVKLQHLCYRTIRKRFGLSANLAIRAIARVAWAIKAARRKGREVKRFRPTSIDYDARIFAYREREEVVSLTTVAGRLRVPLVLGDFQRRALRGTKPTAAKVVLRGRHIFVHVVIEQEPGQKSHPTCALGVDRGVYNLAVTSAGTFHSGREAMDRRERFAARRRALQRLGTKGARRALRRLSGREHRYMRAVNHKISKSIVREARRRNAVIVVEKLDGIRERTRRFSPVWRRRVNAWAFRQLEGFVRYKAEAAGVEVVGVNPRDTSRTCPRCGTVDKSSRRGAHFRCAGCGYRSAADLCAARAIAGRHACPATAVVNRPMASSGHLAPSGASPAL